MVIYKFRNLNTGQATPIPPGEFTVGRNDDAYVYVDDGSVSRRHAKIFNLDDSLFLEDAGSANGTAARGAFVTERVKLEFDDVVHIGSVPFRVDPEVTAEASPSRALGVKIAPRVHTRQATERLPKPGELKRMVVSLPAHQLVAPEVNTATDADAEELNAVIIREPQAPLLQEPSVRASAPLPSVQNLAPPKPRQEPVAPRKTPVQKIVVPAVTPPKKESAPLQPTLESLEQSPVGISKAWGVLIFLAGMGVGLLLGLCLAKLFLDLGGKAAYLP